MVGIDRLNIPAIDTFSPQPPPPPPRGGGGVKGGPHQHSFADLRFLHKVYLNLAPWAMVRRCTQRGRGYGVFLVHLCSGTLLKFFG